jgi:hypothetical protein
MGAAQMGVRSRFARCPHIRIDVWGTRLKGGERGCDVGLVLAWRQLGMMIMGAAQMGVVSLREMPTHQNRCMGHPADVLPTPASQLAGDPVPSQNRCMGHPALFERLKRVLRRLENGAP